MPALHDRNSRVYCVSWRMPAMSARSVAVPTSSSRSRARAPLRPQAAFEAASTRWPSVWPSGISRTPAETRLDAIAVQESVQRRHERDAVAGAGRRDRDRIGERAVPRSRRAGRAPAHGQAARVICDEGLRPARWFPGSAPCSRQAPAASSATAAERLIVAAAPTARCAWAEDHGVAEHAAVADHGREPAAQRVGIADIAGLDRPFDAAGIGERADRIGRRQPGHQPIELRIAGLLARSRGFALE